MSSYAMFTNYTANAFIVEEKTFKWSYQEVSSNSELTGSNNSSHILMVKSSQEMSRYYLMGYKWYFIVVAFYSEVKCYLGIS